MDPDYSKISKIPFMQFAYYNNYRIFDAIQGLKHFAQSKSDPYFGDGFIPHPDNIYHTRPDGYIAPEHLVFAANMDVSELTDSTLYYELYEKRQTFKWDSKRAKYLTKIFNLCKLYNIELTLYESPAYSGSIKDQPNRQDFLNKTDSIASSHNSVYLKIDDKSIIYDKTNFVCPLILSIKGTIPFLKIFADTVNQRLNRLERIR